MSNSIRILSAEDVQQALPMSDAVDGMKRAFAALSTGQATMPLRGRVNANGGTTLIMPAHVHGDDGGDFGVKVVSVFPENAKRGEPIIYSGVLVFDPMTGRPLALMEGGTLTAIRTGAGIGAATDVLARADSRVVAIIGSGVQARTQLEAVCAVRDIERVLVFSRTVANAEAFATTMAGTGAIPARIDIAPTPEDAVSQADIVCAATTSTTPVFSGNALKAGTHINGVGSYTPEMQEVDEVTLQRALIAVDARESVLAEAGEIIIAIEQGAIAEKDIHAEIGEVIADKAIGRTSNDQITFFKSCGVAVQDAVAARIALDNAEKHDIGQVVPF